MKTSVVDYLTKLCDETSEVQSSFGLTNWSNRAASFLRTALGPDASDEFLQLKDEDEWLEHSLRLGHLQGLIAREASQGYGQAPPASAPKQSHQAPAFDSRKVFVVHGHDEAAKAKAARFLEKLKLVPIILHEQPSSGRTIIEKFETYSGDIAFAVILLTPDDIGSSEKTPKDLKPRARQNVVMELGYFLGRLGRSRVCALHKGHVELPSDYQGVLYIELDDAGAWQAKLAQEFVQSKMPIDLTGLLGA